MKYQYTLKIVKDHMTMNIVVAENMLLDSIKYLLDHDFVILNIKRY